MKKFLADDRGQIHTIEGLVAGLILVLTLMYITNSITFVAPQTEKTTVMKMMVKADDILTVLSTSDQPTIHDSELTRDIASWMGVEASDNNEWGAGETSIARLDGTIKSIVPLSIVFNSNSEFGTDTFTSYKTYVLFNLDISYVNDTATAAQGHVVFDNRQLIHQGVPQENAVKASKIIILNDKDLAGTSGYWKNIAATTPKIVEAKLSLWFV